MLKLNISPECLSKEVYTYLPCSVLNRERVLNDGQKFPMVSFGVGFMDGFESFYNAVDVALECGYRSFDCPPVLNNEANLGRTLRELLPKYKLERKDITIKSKILTKDYGVDSTTEALWRSCEELGTNYLDMYLMDWPGGKDLDSEDEENLQLRTETWKELLKLKSYGLVKSVGVSNFEIKHLKHIFNSSKVFPSLNQVEFHPRFPQKELLDYCNKNKILMQTASFKDSFHPLVVTDDVVHELTKTLKKTAVQILLKWCLNKGVAVISQSGKPKIIRQNFEVYDFILEKPTMDAINSINIRQKMRSAALHSGKKS